jgi:hypothetical protein
MSSLAHVLIERQELAQLGTVDYILSNWDLMGDLLTLAKGGSAVDVMRRSLRHLSLEPKLARTRLRYVGSNLTATSFRQSRKPPHDA